MDTWPKFYERVTSYASAMSGIVYYRGHGRVQWRLLPGVGRVVTQHRLRPSEALSLERNYYFDFVAKGGDLIPRTNDSWDNLFLMQHHGLPTRLLDWAESFAIAVYFALLPGYENPAIWVLNPYDLNDVSIGRRYLLDVDDLDAGYDEYFLRESKTFGGDVVALRPRRHVRRLAQQVAGFTLHRDVSTPLDRLHRTAVRKFVMPKTARLGASKFLTMAGISEYTLFPDLDGLARHLKQLYLS